MSKLILIGILLSTFPLHVHGEGWVNQTYFSKLQLTEKPSDPVFVKKTKQKLRELRWESLQIERKCRADTKKYFVQNCARSREKITRKTEQLVQELASARNR